MFIFVYCLLYCLVYFVIFQIVRNCRFNKQFFVPIVTFLLQDENDYHGATRKFINRLSALRKKVKDYASLKNALLAIN